MARTKQIDPNVAVSQWRLVARRFGPRDLHPFVAMRDDPEVARGACQYLLDQLCDAAGVPHAVVKLDDAAKALELGTAPSDVHRNLFRAAADLLREASDAVQAGRQPNATSPAVSAFTGSVNSSSKPSGFARISCTSNGVLPVQSSRWSRLSFMPRTGQPRFVPPATSCPRGVKCTARRPVPSPSRNG